MVNPNKISQMATSGWASVQDNVSAIHSGIVKSLNQMSSGNMVIEGCNVTQTLSGTSTRFDVANGKYLRDGLLVTFSAANKLLNVTGSETASQHFTNSNTAAEGIQLSFITLNYDYYVILVFDSAGVLQIRGDNTLVNALNPKVANLTAADTPICIIKIGGAEDAVATRSIQYVTVDKPSNSFSIAKDNSGTYTETASITAPDTTTALITAASGVDVKIKLAGTASGDTFEVIDGGSTTQFKVQGDGLVATTGNIKIGGNVIQASDGGSTITMDTSDNVTIAGDLTVSGGDIIYSNAQNATNTIASTATGVVGKSLTISSGSPVTGGTNNIAGGSITFKGGQGKGTGAGGDIIFQTANASGSGNSLNAYATALTISDDLSSTFAGDITLSNGATIVNTSSSVLTITEATTAFSAGITTGTYVSAATTVGASLGLISDGYISLEPFVEASPAMTPGKSVYYLNSGLPTCDLPDATTSSQQIITIKNIHAVPCIVQPINWIPGPSPDLIDDGHHPMPSQPLLTAANQITLAKSDSITLQAHTDSTLPLTTGWQILG